MGKQKMILDCDPGHDDAVAILLAAKNDVLELIGITVVAGNQTIDNTVRNALNVCQALELEIPVYAGCGGPMVREQVVAGDIHGESGLDGPVFEPLKKEREEEHAVNYIVRALMESDEKITIVTTGPMTNLAMAMRMEPKIKEKIKEIVLMGGCYQNGNVTPAAEFNIFADGEAAYACFNSGLPITMVGLDVTRKALCYPAIVDRMEKIGTKASKLFVDLMRHFNKSQKEVFGWDGGPLHDPITIAYLIDPTVLTVKPMHSEIEIRSEQSYGRTNCDFFDYQQKDHNSDIAIDIDTDKFWDIVEDALKRY
ncbi:ribosylpyrimidine nucleosidase [Aequitasia blattaphilus]|uniref:Nucleoside hydrolase n=1 Tax=Aequitasia blattaphilus TaxID=2949332 RepID=A0ABT1E8I4_9FIRM|nr:nucleoside hydrolase [Aequitasia blattaphilus]MCP1101934.1 nucleoside hydrolase [Aequitasia blattaphilus]MCR8614574.1 nucleoside hydrolase [Aequitasia blattaphilus]